MKNQNAKDFLNLAGEMFGAFAEQFGQSGQQGKSGKGSGHGPFYDKLRGFHEKMTTAYYAELLKQGFTQQQAEKLIKYMNQPPIT